jgi:hypothetical protein
MLKMIIAVYPSKKHITIKQIIPRLKEKNVTYSKDMRSSKGIKCVFIGFGVKTDDDDNDEDEDYNYGVEKTNQSVDITN